MSLMQESTSKAYFFWNHMCILSFGIANKTKLIYHIRRNKQMFRGKRNIKTQYDISFKS